MGSPLRDSQAVVTITGNLYVEQIKNCMMSYARNILFHQDNASAYNLIVTTAAFKDTGSELMELKLDGVVDAILPRPFP